MNALQQIECLLKVYAVSRTTDNSKIEKNITFTVSHKILETFTRLMLEKHYWY